MDNLENEVKKTVEQVLRVAQVTMPDVPEHDRETFARDMITAYSVVEMLRAEDETVAMMHGAFAAVVGYMRTQRFARRTQIQPGWAKLKDESQ